MTALRTALAAMALLLTTASARAVITFHNDELGFTITIPDGWKQVDDKKVQAFPISKPQGGDAAYIAGFSRSGSLTPPFVLIEGRTQPWSLEGATPEQIRARLNLTPLADLQKNGTFDRLGHYTGDTMSPAAFDLENRRILAQGYTTTPDGKAVFLESVNFLGSEDFVRVNCFVPTETASMHAGDVKRILDSFGFDPGAAYEPPPPPRTRSGVRFGRGGTYGLGFGGIGLLAYFLRRWASE